VLVAHLIDADTGEGGVLACAAALAGSPADIHHRVLAIGPAWVQARAHELGLNIHERVAAGVSALSRARALRAALRATGSRPDALQAWSVSAGATADRAGFGSRLVICGSTPRDPARWLAGPTVAAWPWQPHDAWRRAGAVDIRELPTPELRPPWIGRGQGGADDYTAVREALGIAPDDEAVALVADPPSDGNARRFVYLLGLLHVGGRRIIGLVPEGCSSLDRAARYTRAHGKRWGLIPVRGPMSRALAGADVAAIDESRPDAAGLLALVARAAGVSVVTIGPGPAAPEVARRTAALANDALDRRREHPARPTSPSAAAPGSPFAATIAEIWRDAAATLHATGA